MSNTKLWGLLWVSLLTSCATLNEDQCLLSEWQDIGYQDGLKGHKYVRIEKHQKACAKHGVAVDSAQYKSGYDSGISAYCNTFDHFQSGKNGNLMNPRCSLPDYIRTYNSGITQYCSSTNAYILGANGGKYHNVCGAAFSELYSDGKKLYGYQAKVRGFEEKIERFRELMVASKDAEFKADKKPQIKDLEDNIKITQARMLAEKIKHRDHFSSSELLLDVIGATK